MSAATTVSPEVSLAFACPDTSSDVLSLSFDAISCSVDDLDAASSASASDPSSYSSPPFHAGLFVSISEWASYADTLDSYEVFAFASAASVGVLGRRISVADLRHIWFVG